jgi:hypothetical protein
VRNLALLVLPRARANSPPSPRTGFEIMTILSLLSFLDHLFLAPGTPIAPAIAIASSSIDPLTQAHLARTRPTPELENGRSALTLGEVEPPTPPRRGSSGGHPVRQGSGGVGGGRVMTSPSPMSGLSSNEIEVRDPARREEDGQRCLKLLEVSRDRYFSLSPPLADGP